MENIAQSSSTTWENIFEGYTLKQQKALQVELEKAKKKDPALGRPIPLSRPARYIYEFPVPSLGNTLAWAAASIAEIVQCPVDISAMSILSAISLASQAHADVVLPIGKGKAVPLSLFLVTVAASGERKTASDGFALKAVKKYEQRLTQDYKAEIGGYQNKHDVWESQRNKALRTINASSADMLAAIVRCGIEPEPPPIPMLTCPEPTWEGLCNLFIEGLPSLGILSNEGGQFLGGHGMNQEARLRTVTNLSTAWDGEGIKRVRAGKGNSHVLPGRRLTLHLMIQPKIAQRFFADTDFQDQGILSRILVSHPESLIGTRMQQEVDPRFYSDLEHYENKLTEMLNVPFQYTAPNNKELALRQLYLDNEAAKLWHEYSDKNEAMMRLGERYENIRALASKLAEHAARIAGCMMLFYNFNATHITTLCLENAMTIADYFADQAVAQLDASMKDTDVIHAEALHEWIKTTWQEKYIGMQVICQRGPNQIRAASIAKRAVALLQENNWLISVGAGYVVNGITVKEAWEVVRE